MTSPPEERVKKWVLRQTIGHSFTSAHVSKDTGIRAKFVSMILSEIALKEGDEKTVKHTNPEKKGVVFVWERI